MVTVAATRGSSRGTAAIMQAPEVSSGLCESGPLLSALCFCLLRPSRQPSSGAVCGGDLHFTDRGSARPWDLLPATWWP